jgi:hypothetical protein
MALVCFKHHETVSFRPMLDVKKVVKLFIGTNPLLFNTHDLFDLIKLKLISFIRN